MAKSKSPKQVETHIHEDAKRKNIPTAEYQPVVDEKTKKPIRLAYRRRNPDLDPQLVWRGKDFKHWSDLVVDAPPLYIQEKVHPKVLIDDLIHEAEVRRVDKLPEQLDLFSDFDGIPEGDAKTEFYQHDAHWANRMILGDSLQVMASLAEREGLREKIQCIYFDPPYGIKFNSNFQWSTNNRNVKDGKTEHITREPEQVKAFRDTWKDGVHSYLTYLRDRLTIAKDLLIDTGSIFVQIGNENVHRVRSIIEEVFGEENFVSEIIYTKTTGRGLTLLPQSFDFILWAAKDKSKVKYRKPLAEKSLGGEGTGTYNYTRKITGQSRRLTKKEKDFQLGLDDSDLIFRLSDLKSQSGSLTTNFTYIFNGEKFRPGKGFWKSNVEGFKRLEKADRLHISGKSLAYRRYIRDYPALNISNLWTDTGTGNFTDEKIYVVQTGAKAIQRCILMTTDPGDLILDPTCGSGTSAYVAEQWGRRWITIDTSRVALALARTRIMGARYPYYLLSDSPEGRLKEAEIERKAPLEKTTFGNLREGFVYERIPHITLKSIANNTEIDVIWESFHVEMESLRKQLNELLNTGFEEWEIPPTLENFVEDKAKNIHKKWWDLRIKRQKEIDASIAAKADSEFLYDKPYEDKAKVRVAGPFTVESISPHRMLGVDENGDTFDQLAQEDQATYSLSYNFEKLILNNLERSGVQQDKKQDRIVFDSLNPWPGQMICAEGQYHEEDGKMRRAGIYIGPEYGSVTRPELVDAAREAADAGFDLVIACGFNYDAHSTEFSKLGRIPVLKARMNADLHMAEDLAATGAGNLFVIFGEPDVELLQANDNEIQIQVKGVDIFDPKTGKVRSDDTDGIACWFVDTNYNGESFFVRHAYFLGANDPYKSLKTTLKAEIDREAWETLNSDISRPFQKPETGRIAIKIINHLGDEVMKVMRVQ